MLRRSQDAWRRTTPLLVRTAQQRSRCCRCRESPQGGLNSRGAIRTHTEIRPGMLCWKSCEREASGVVPPYILNTTPRRNPCGPWTPRPHSKTEGESMSAHNDLRADQILYNHGPGSVLETKRGPAIVNSLPARAFLPRSTSPKISGWLNPGKSLLGETARLYRLPTNEDVGDRGRAIVSTRTFPRWLLCSCHPHKTILHPGPGPGKPGCSECGGYDGRPVRFVQFCSKGHLEEIDWWSAVHPKGSKCGSQTFEWSGGGGALRNLTISCTMCSASTTMDQIRYPPCRGGHLHLGQDTNDCDERARVTLRGSTQIWQGLHRRVISIPQDDLLKLVATVMEDDLVARRTLAQVAAMGNAMAAAGLVAAEGPSDREHYIEAINFKINPRKPMFTADANRLINAVIRSGPGGVGDFESTYVRLLDDGTNFVVDVFDDEFRGLVNSPRPHVHPAAPAAPWFIIEGAGGHGRSASGPPAHTSSSNPSPRSEASLLEGFVRGAVQDGPTPVDVGFDLGDERWLPATESFGEGLLLQLSDDSTLRDGGVRWNEWAQAHTNEVARCIAGGEPKRFIHRAESDIDPMLLNAPHAPLQNSGPSLFGGTPSLTPSSVPFKPTPGTRPLPSGNGFTSPNGTMRGLAASCCTSQKGA